MAEKSDAVSTSPNVMEHPPWEQLLQQLTELNATDIKKELKKLNSTQHVIQTEVSKISLIQDDVAELKDNLSEYKTSLEFSQNQLADACEEINDLKAQVTQIPLLKSEVDQLKAQNLQLEQKLTYMDEYSRRENLIVEGVPEKKGENCMEVIQEIFSRVGLDKSIQIQRCHRLYVKHNQVPNMARPLIVRFVCFQDKLAMLRKRDDLRRLGMTVRDDLPAKVDKSRAMLRPVLRYLKEKGETATLVRN